MKKKIKHILWILTGWDIFKDQPASKPGTIDKFKVNQMTAQEKQEAVQRLRKQLGWIACCECGRSAGFTYKGLDKKTHGLTLHKIPHVGYMCEDCLRNKADVRLNKGER